MPSDVLFERDGHAAVITLNRPEVLNAYRYRTFEELYEIWTEVNVDDAIRVAVLAGAGRAFCAGGDLKVDLAAEVEAAPIPRFDDDLDVVKPVIAAIHGYCLGGGLSMALASDIRLAADDAVFGYPQVKRGTVGVYSSGRLPRVVARGPAMELVLTGEIVDASEARRIGLVNRVVPPSDLLPAALAMAHRIAENAPAAVQDSKASALGRTLAVDHRQTAAAEAGRRAFAERRRPGPER